ncbi:hypothetical protein [Phenylobacterium montanum]|uniref:Uncharacterized protein n=1 Tax=Phenylobacterium montanum TaxID=2823693 RepID=A0A975FV79_9CAUL|nr:hypothetical protein [Caulobacter sp. S6]QUD86098.1 hypothetical protein KCG34_13400 [Caulobacter sp. S6]
MPVRPVIALLVAPVLALSAAGGALAGQDRYGPSMRPESGADQAPAPTTYLTWPGKAPVAARPAAEPRPLPSSIYAPPPALGLRPAESPSAYAPQKPAPVRTASAALHPRPAPVAKPAPPPAQPAAPVQPTPAAVAANSAMPAHFYSVQREFGLKPDPIPLPNQFFADGSSNDLAGPPPPPPPHLIPGQSASSAANVQRAQMAADMAEGDAPPSN